MTPDLAVLLIAVPFLFAGFGVLSVTELRPVSIVCCVRSFGLAFVVGMGLILLIEIALLCLQVPFTLLTFSLVAFLVGAGGFAFSFRRRWLQLTGVRQWFAVPPPTWKFEYVLAGLALVALAVFEVLSYRWAKALPLLPSDWDGWSIWARKGALLYEFHSIPLQFFTSHAYTFMHPDYPLAIPVLNATWFHFLGWDTRSLHAEYWILYVAVLWAAADISARFARPLAWVPIIGLLAVLPAVRSQLVTLYADIPMGLLLMLAVLLLGTWFAERRPYQLGLATLFLAVAANMKNEGLAAALVLIVLVWALTAIKPPVRPIGPALKQLLISTGGFLLAIAPWRLWLIVHHIGSDVPLAKGLDLGYVAGRLGRLGPTVSYLFRAMTATASWRYLLVSAAAVLVCCVFVSGLRRRALFFILGGLGVFGSLVWVYVISANPLSWYLQTSGGRTIDSVMFIAAGALLCMTCRLLPPHQTLLPEDVDAQEPDPADAMQAGAGEPNISPA